MFEQQQTLTVQQSLDLAVEHHSSGRLPQAETIFQQILQSYPNHPIALHWLGVIAHQMGKHDKAVDQITKALSLKPDYAEAHYNLGLAFKKLGKLEEAIASYRKALTLKPDLAELHNNLGNALKDLGKLDDAITSYGRALILKPDYAEAHYNLGNALKDQGRSEEAIVSYRKALDIRPDYAVANYNLGNTLQGLGKPEEAIASYRKALTLKPDLAELHNNLGNALKDLGKPEEAVASYQRALDIKPDYAVAYNNLGVAFKDLGKPEEAVTSYEKALALKPDHAETHYNLGNALAEQGKHRESVTAYQRSFASRTGIRPAGNEDLAPATNGLYLELTNKCNFHCDFCPSDSQKRALGFMDLDLAKRAYEEIEKKKLALQVDLHLMGEPTLHPKLIEILNFGASKNVETELVTNGSTLVAKVVPRILDALYGTIVASHMTPTEETYHIRGNINLSWDRYIGNIRLLVREYIKRLGDGKNVRNKVVIRVMVTKDTASNVNIIQSTEQARVILMEWINFVSKIERELGIPSFGRQEPDMNNLFRENLHASTEYRLQRGIVLTFWRAFTFANSRVSDDYQLQQMEETVFCPHPFNDVGVLWNGDVTLCCLDHDGQLKVGNIQDTSIQSVVQSEAANNLRASMLGRRPLPRLCQTCQARPVKRGESATKSISESINFHSSIVHTN